MRGRRDCAPARNPTSPCPRFAGTHLLAAGIVLWALAVWVFGTPAFRPTPRRDDDGHGSRGVGSGPRRGNGTAAGESAGRRARPGAGGSGTDSRGGRAARTRAPARTRHPPPSRPAGGPHRPGAPAAATGDSFIERAGYRRRLGGRPARSLPARRRRGVVSVTTGAAEILRFASAPALPPVRLRARPNLPPPPRLPGTGRWLRSPGRSTRLGARRGEGTIRGRRRPLPRRGGAPAPRRPCRVGERWGNVLWTMRRWPEAA